MTNDSTHPSKSTESDSNTPNIDMNSRFGHGCTRPASEETERRPSVTTVVVRATLAALVVLSLFAVAVPVVTADAGSAALSGPPTASVSADEALDAREAAKDRLAELRRLDDRPMVSVEASTLQTVQNRIETGNLSYTRANYDTAAEHWSVAEKQATAALARAYAEGTARNLNATVGFIEKREEKGYATADTAEFTERAAGLRAQTPETLSDHRKRYRAARQLNSDVESSLPSMNAVRLANWLSPMWVAGGVVVALGAVTSVVGFALGRRGQSEPETEDTGTEPEVEGSGLR